jgi:hypothetical protein
MERCFSNLYLFEVFSPTPYSQDNFDCILHQFASHLSLIKIWIQLNWIGIEYSWIQIQLIEISFNVLEFNLIKSKFNSNSTQVELNVVLVSRTLKNIFCFTRIYIFSLFFYAFSLGANKDNLLHVTNCITSSSPFGWNSFMSRLLQHVMSLTY